MKLRRKRRKFSSNPLRGMPSWLTPLLLIGGAILVVNLIKKGTQAAETAMAPARLPHESREE